MNEPPVYQRGFFGRDEPVARVGQGSLGGKAQGLLAFSRLLRERFPPGTYPGLEVVLPRLVVLATGFHEAFLEVNGLRPEDFAGASDAAIARAFLGGSLPPRFVGDLRDLAEEVHVPLAVRSSSLLEDAMFRPFAGVYATKMIPNNQASPDERFRHLADAIKFVLASTWFSAAQAYRESLPEQVGEERMAVIIQEVVGRRHGDRYYPTISGVARSWSFYPSGHARPEDGVVQLALGLGKTIVDGGTAWGYCPRFPRSPPPYNDIGDLMKNSQTRFWAVNMGRPPVPDPTRETEYLAQAGLEDAEYDNTLRFVASTYDPRSDRLVPSVTPRGPRVLDFAPILKLDVFPLNDAVGALLRVAEEATSAHVEIEFAVVAPGPEGGPARLGFLQVRPMVVSHEPVDVGDLSGQVAGAVATSVHCLGNGVRTDIRDVVYLVPEDFDPHHTPAMARELEQVNAALLVERRPYLLAGFGRWGTSDPWYGVPVAWGQISGARVIVEATLPDVDSDLSQGSHFFHNVTSLQVLYLSVPHQGPHAVDWGWLAGQPEVRRGRFVRHVRLDQPLEVRVDGRTGRGVVLRHEG